MKDFDHPNVLRLIGVCLDSPNCIPYLVLPFMENGSIKDYLKSKRVHVTDFDTLPKVRAYFQFASWMQGFYPALTSLPHGKSNADIL